MKDRIKDNIVHKHLDDESIKKFRHMKSKTVVNFFRPVKLFKESRITKEAEEMAEGPEPEEHESNEDETEASETDSPSEEPSLTESGDNG